VIERYGADALRYTVVSGMAVGTDLILDPADLDASFAPGRHFANKLWNIGRLLLGQFGEGTKPLAAVPPESLTLADRWILARAHETIGAATQQYERFRLNEAAGAIYHFLWSDLADWYLEQIKPRLYDSQPGGDVARAVAAHVFDIALRLLHPVMPFITETLWQRLPGRAASDSISISRWPTAADAPHDAAALAEFGSAQGIIGAIRALRAEYGVAPGQPIHVTITEASALARRAIAAESDTVRRLAKIGVLDLDGPAVTNAVTSVLADRTTIMIPLGDLVDVAQECARLAAEATRLDGLAAAQETKLANPQFVARAPAAIVDKERDKLAALRAQADALREQRKALGCSG
jgi:valyl-tRNA synthetase